MKIPSCNNRHKEASEAQRWCARAVLSFDKRQTIVSIHHCATLLISQTFQNDNVHGRREAESVPIMCGALIFHNGAGGNRECGTAVEAIGPLGLINIPKWMRGLFIPVFIVIEPREQERAGLTGGRLMKSRQKPLDTHKRTKGRSAFSGGEWKTRWPVDVNNSYG